MTFGEKLKKLRTEKDLTQEELASELLISRTLLTKYENDKVIPSKDTLKRISDYFDIDLNKCFMKKRYQLPIRRKDKIEFICNFIMLIVMVITLLVVTIPMIHINKDIVDFKQGQIVNIFSLNLVLKYHISGCIFVGLVSISIVLTSLYFLIPKVRDMMFYKIINYNLMTISFILFITTIIQFIVICINML